MATIYLSLSAKADKVTDYHEILIRFTHGRINQRAKSNVFIHPDYWNEKNQSIEIPKIRIMTDERKQLQSELQVKSDRLNEIKSEVMTSFQGKDPNNVPKDWLKNLIHDFNFPKADAEEEHQQQISFIDELKSFIDNQKLSDHRRRQHYVMFRSIKRFELYKNISLTFENITPKVLIDYENFLLGEHELVKQKNYQKILKAVPECRTIKARGQNTINDYMIRLRSFFIWANDNDMTTNNPFKKYKIVECVYGTPIYINIDERNHLYNFDFADKPALSKQRDIFVFQCLIGCRVSDLKSFTKSNIVDGAIEYIPRKTKDGRAVTVRVPLHPIAKEIIERYKDCDETKLLPFISEQKYNDAIKRMFRLAGITRMVTIINPTTREEEQRPICDVASSHLARRCFVGNLYKQVKDPNLIGKLSGHKEGSRAFARYRNIDEETSRELINLL